MQKSVIIVAGGLGMRMNSDLPKQFMIVAGKPVLMHTLLKFYHFDQKLNIVLVLPREHIETWNLLCSQHRFFIPHQIETGGSERFFSVKNGFKHIDEKGIVAIHDGVRPLVSGELIQHSFDAAAKFGSAIPVTKPPESVRKVDSSNSHPVDRDHYRLVQTPQTFKASLILEAYELAWKPQFTDDATVLEAAGHQVHLIEGAPENIKITRPSDLIFAEALFNEDLRKEI
jgi:2-C-methyl-D-erythritol 4-phosphate cytidylyltransferase